MLAEDKSSLSTAADKPLALARSYRQIRWGTAFIDYCSFFINLSNK